MDNPSFMLVRNGRLLAPGKREMASSRWKDRKITVNEFFARPEDRIILFSDGVTQAGMGSWANPTGWGQEKCAAFILDTLRERPGISSRELSRRVVSKRSSRAARAGRDDVTCAVMYFARREAARALRAAVREEGDAEFADAGYFRRTSSRLRRYDHGDRRRELGRPLVTDCNRARRPAPISTMGADLITEGILTLTEVSRILEGRRLPARRPRHRASPRFWRERPYPLRRGDE